jgi:hypothetical protein
MPILSEKRAADRKTMADAVAELVTACGATYKREDHPDRREVWLDITAPGGLELTVDFDGNSIQPDIHVLSWHMSHESPNRLNNATFGGNVNPHHKCKATYIAEGFEDLCRQLTSGLLMAKDGTAYLPLPVPA